MNKTLSACLANRNNNLDIIRFLAALAVIYSHSFDITYQADTEPLYKLTHQLLSIGHFSVSVFFIISGFLITQSYNRRKSVQQYFIARILRIYPGLIFVILCTLFIIGPFLTDYNFLNYFTSKETIKYGINVLSLKIYFRLGGVLESEPFPNFAINGSLWTLPYELVCYLIVPAVGMLLEKRIVKAFILLAISTVFVFFQQAEPLFVNAVSFLVGSLIYLYRDKIVLNPVIFFAALVVLVINLLFNVEFFSFHIFTALSLSYVIIFIAFYKVGLFKDFTKNGDYSYGLYIWAFPVQQIVFHQLVRTGPLANFIISSIITFVLAYISWHLIEKRALTLKNYTFSGIYRRYFPIEGR